MSEFFAGVAIVFALFLFGRKGGRPPGALPPGMAPPTSFPPNNPSYGNSPNLPSGPTSSGCGCKSAASSIPPPSTQTPYGNIAPAQPNYNAPTAYNPPPAPASAPTLYQICFPAGSSQCYQSPFALGG